MKRLTVSPSFLPGKFLRIASAAAALLMASAGAVAAAQVIAIDSPVASNPGFSAINLGDIHTGFTSSSGFTFHTTAGISISSVTVDLGIAGVNDFANVSWGGACRSGSLANPGLPCSVTFDVTPRYVATQTSTVTFVTSAGTFTFGLMYRGVGSQVAFTPGTIGSVKLQGGASEAPTMLAIDYKGNAFFADPNAKVIKRRDAATGVVTIFAGNGGSGYGADGGLASATLIGVVRALALAPSGDLYFVGDGPSTWAIRKVSLTTGILTTVTGIPGTPYASAPAGPLGMAVNKDGYVYLTVSPSGSGADWAIVAYQNGVFDSVLATGGCSGFLSGPSTLGLDASTEQLYYASAGRIYTGKADLTGASPTTCLSGVTSIAGTGTAGFNGDGLGVTAQISSQITGLAPEVSVLYIADAGNHTLRQLNLADGTLISIAGTGAAGYAGDGGSGPLALLQGMGQLVVDAQGNLFVTDSVDDVIRSLIVSTFEADFALSPVNHRSSDSPKGLRATNVGTVPMVFTVPSTGFNPAISAGFSIDVSGCPSLNPSSAPGQALAAGFSCGMNFSATPVQPGVTVGSLDFFDNAAGGKQSVTLVESAPFQTTAFVAPTTIPFVDTPVGTTANSWTATLNNTGEYDLNISGITISNPVFAYTTTCGGVLPKHSTCLIVVNFSPTAAQSYTGVLTVVDDAIDGNQYIQLSGTGTDSTPIVSLSPLAATFGNVPKGTTSNSWSFNLSNQSGKAVVVDSVAVSSTDFVLNSSCGASLAAYSSCTILVSFAPQSVGTISGTLTVKTEGNPGTLTATLSGTGTDSTPVLTLLPSGADFGSVAVNTTGGTTSNSWSFNVSNQSGTDVGFDSIGVSNTNFVSTTACGAKILAHSSCTIVVSFAPQSLGAISGVLTVKPTGLAALTATLNGVGTDGTPRVQISPTDISFSPQAQGTTGNPWTVNVSNLDATTIAISSIKLSDANDFVVTGSSCGATLAGYSSCQLLVAFSPKSVGTITGTLTVVENGIPGTLVVNLNGQGTQPQPTISISPTVISFGSQMQGTTSNTWSVNLSNMSGAAIALTSVTLSDSADFALTSNCPAVTLPAYSSCQFTVAFTPKGTGNYSGVLTVVSNGNPGTLTVSMSGTGTTNVPVAFVSPSNISFSPTTVGTSANPWTATLNNTSQVPLAIGAIHVTNSQFSFTTTCGATLAANSTCNLYVGFTPTTATGVSGALVIPDNSAAGSEVITLNGTGVAPQATAQLAPSVVSFSNQTVGTQGNPWTLNFSNMGGSALTISSIVLSDTTNFAYTSACGTVVPAYSSCHILAYFKPSGATTYNATLTVNTNGLPGAVVSSLSGTGTPVPVGYALSVTPGALTMKAGQSANATFSFAPQGGYTGSVSFACVGMPIGATCTFAPAKLTADGSNRVQTSVLTVSTTGLASNAVPVQPGGRSMTVFFGMSFGMLGLLLVGKRTRVRSLLMAVVGLAVMAGAMGCASGYSADVTSAGTSKITVSGTVTGATQNAAVTQNATFTLTITQ